MINNFQGVHNIEGNNGPVKNQFEIFTKEGKYFQSYSSIIAFKPVSGKIVLDSDKWDFSKTTGRYRNLFLNESKAETMRKIKSGEYTLANLN